MNKTLIALTLAAPMIGQSQAALIFGGDFQLYKPGTGYTVTGELSGPGAFDSYAQGVGDGVNIAGTPGVVNFSDSTSGSVADLPGWVIINGGNPDTGLNGVGGTSGLNIFAAWGGNQRVETSSPVGTVVLGEGYTITAMVDGPAGGPVEGDLAFDLLANGVVITPDVVVDPLLPGGNGFQEVSRTYSPATLAAFDGQDLTIVVGVADSNALPNRMIWDDVSFDTVAIPEPSALLLLGFGGMAFIRRKRS